MSPTNAEREKQQRQLLGVTYDPMRGKWKARIFCGGREWYIGRYTNSLDAAMAYDQAARYINSKVQHGTSLWPASAEASGSSSTRTSRRQLNLPHLTPSCPVVAQRLADIFAPGEFTAGDLSPAADSAATTGHPTGTATPDDAYGMMPAQPAAGGISLTAQVAPQAGCSSTCSGATGNTALFYDPVAAAAASGGGGGGPGLTADGIAVQRAHSSSSTSWSYPYQQQQQQQTQTSVPPQQQEQQQGLPAAAAAAAVLPSEPYLHPATEVEPEAADAAAAGRQKRGLAGCNTGTPPKRPLVAAVPDMGRTAASCQAAMTEAAGATAVTAAAGAGACALLQPDLAAAATVPAAVRGTAKPQPNLQWLNPGMLHQQPQPQPHVPMLEGAAHASPAGEDAKPAPAAAVAGSIPSELRPQPMRQPQHRPRQQQAAIALPAQLQLPPAPASCTQTPEQQEFLDDDEWQALMELLDSPRVPSPLASEPDVLAQIAAEWPAPNLSSADPRDGDKTNNRQPAGAATGYTAAYVQPLEQQQHLQQLEQHGMRVSSIVPGAACGTAGLLKQVSDAGRGTCVRAGSNASSTSDIRGVVATALTAATSTAHWQPAQKSAAVGAETPTGEAPNTQTLRAPAAAPGAAMPEQYVSRLQQLDCPAQEDADIMSWQLLDSVGLPQQSQAQLAHQLRPRLQPPRLLPAAQCCQPLLPQQPPQVLLPPRGPQGSTHSSASRAPLTALMGPQLVAGQGRQPGQVSGAVPPTTLLQPLSAAATAAAGFVRTGMPAGTGASASVVAGAPAGLLVSISTPAQALAFCNSCLHQLTDLELYLLQQQLRPVSAVGTMLEWLQAAWHNDVLTSCEVGRGLSSSPAAVAAAIAAAKAQQACPRRLALRVLDQMVLVAGDVLATSGSVSAAEQQTFMLEFISKVCQGLTGLQCTVSQAAAGGSLMQCRVLLQAWIPSRLLPHSSPAVVSAIQQLVQLL